MQNSKQISSKPGAISINTAGDMQQNKYDTVITNSSREGETDRALSALVEEWQQQAGQPANDRSP